LAGQTNVKGNANKRRSYLDVVRLSFIRVPYLHKGKKRNKKDTNYHHYSTLAPSGELWPTKGMTYDANESEAGRA
jgi:hypothetical protein